MNKAKLYNILAAALFILLLGLFSYKDIFDWPAAVLLSVGTSLALRQLLLGFPIDALVAAALFGALFFFTFLQFFPRLFLPTFLIIGALYYILRQFFDFKREKDHDKTSSLPPQS